MRPRSACRAIAMAIAAAVSPIPIACGANLSWTDGALDNSWINPSDWNPAAVPASGDDVYVNGGDAFTDSVTYNYAGPAIILDSVNIGLSNGLFNSITNELRIPGNTLIANVETAGNSSGGGSKGKGEIAQSGGTNSINTQLTLGSQATDTGSYFLSQTGTLNFASEQVGLYGSGTFSQSGGTNAGFGGVLSGISVATGSGSSGTYTLTGGSLTTNDIVLGGSGSGTMNQSAGQVTLNPVTANSPILMLGQQIPGIGNYKLSGTGALSVNSGTETVGYSGTGTFTQSAGSNTITYPSGVGNEGLIVGSNAGATGTYHLDGGTLQLTDASEFIGFSGNGTFDQTNGTHTLASDTGAGAVLYLAQGAGSSGTYNLSGGSLTCNDLFMGSGGSATFNHSAGTVTLNGAAVFSLVNGAYNLSGTGELSSDAGQEFISAPSGSTAIFNQTGGTNTLNGTGFATISIANGSGTTGAYDLNGGSLSARDIYIAGDSTGPSSGIGTFALNAPNGLSLTDAMTVYAGGTLTGSGSTNAAVFNSGTVAPGNPTGTLTVGPITFYPGSKLLLDSGALLASTDAVDIGFGTRVQLNGLFSGSMPIISYAAGAAAPEVDGLGISGGTAGYTYTARADTANHAVTLAARWVGRHDQTSVAGEAGPGGDVFTLGVGPGAMNAAGQIEFAADFSDGTGLVRLDGNAYTLIEKGGTAAPGAGGGTLTVDGFVNNFDNINAAGQTAFQSYLSGTSDSSTVGIFRGDGGPIVCIARDQEALPGGTGTLMGFAGGNGYNYFHLSSINDAGQVAFGSTIANAPDGSTAGMFRGDGNSITTIARQVQSAPGAGGGSFGSNFPDFSPSMNNAGQVAFTASLAYTSDGSTAGVFRGDGNSLIAIARQNQIPPGAGGGTYGSEFDLGVSPAINASGQVAFSASLVGTSDGAAWGLYRGDGSTTTQIERDKQPAPGGGLFSGLVGTFAMNDAGQVAFVTSLSNAPDGADKGLFRSDGVHLIAIARDGEIAPGTADATLIVGSSTIGPGGQVAFGATLQNPIDGATNDGALYEGDGQDLVPIALPGQSIMTSQGLQTLGHFLELGGPLNAYGQIPWTFFTSAGSGNFLFTPVLHWRSPTGGSWDTSSNWTLGLEPALVHDVVIDPASALTVNGSASSRIIKSLTIGTGGAPATLQLGGTGVVLHLLGPISIDTAGGSKLDLRDSKLITTSPVGTWNGSAYDGVTGLVASARNGGAWNGVGITSSLASTGGSNLYTLGVAKAGDIKQISDSATATFGGQTVHGSDTIVMYTYGGDANLDGKINIDDYGRIDGNVGQSGSVFGWYNGDFNYDGKINIDDYGIIDGNIGLQGAPIPSAAGAVALDGVSAVPEPASLGLLALAGAGLLSWRRQKRDRSN